MLNQDPHVQVSIIFGRGRFNAGVLIEPKDQFKFDPIDQAKLAEFRNKIWYVKHFIADAKNGDSYCIPRNAGQPSRG